MALAFDRSEDFGLDKPAEAPCPHLTRAHRCAIHASLMQSGFRGCVHYDCLGAGQRVTQEMFAGRSWRDDPAIAPAMFEAFRILRRVHELLALLDAAARWTMTDMQAQRRDRLRGALSPHQGWSLESLRAFERGTLGADVRSFLSSLRPAPRGADAERDRSEADKERPAGRTAAGGSSSRQATA